MAKINVDTFIDADKASKDTETDALNIKGEVARQSGLTYYYTTKYAAAIRQAARLKLQLEIKEAQVAQEIRTQAATDGIKMTVDQVKDAVRVHKDTVALEVAKIDADEVEEVLKGIVAAIKDKSSNLITLTTLERDEIKANLLVDRDLNPSVNTSLATRDRHIKDSLAA